MTDDPMKDSTVSDSTADDSTVEVTAVDESTPNETSGDEPRADAADRPQYGVGPFSIREVCLVGVWLIAFVVSFFSIASEQAMSQLLFGGSVWANGLDWILTIGVPSVAVFLVILRRFSPDGIRRVGSLGIDQFASVAFSVSAVVWLGLLWRTIGVAISTGVWVYGWVVWVELFLMLVGVVLTVVAPFIPPFSEDFVGRREIVAHRNARPIRAVSARPARPVVEKPAASSSAADAGAAAYAAGAYGSAGSAESGYAGYADPGYIGAAQPADDSQPFADTATPDDEARHADAAAPGPAHQAFWALAPQERVVVDERGVPLFRVGPDARALVLEDRGEVFVVRHEDGRVGYLHDVSGVTRG